MQRYEYMLYGMKVVSDLEFHQLVVCEDEKEPDIKIVSGVVPDDILDCEAGKKYEFGNQRSWLANKTCYLVAEDGKKLTYQMKPDGKVAYLQSYLLGFGMSMLAMQRGILSIHCSAVADERGALLIAGESGAGKSTLTAAFLEKGYRLMADDMAWVEITEEQKVMARPAFPYQKLCRDAALAKGYDLESLLYINEDKDKFLVPYRGAFQTESVPVKGFLMLGVTDKDTVVCMEAVGMQKFQVCANNLFLRHLLGNDKYAPQTGQRCLKMAAGIPIYYIGRPYGKDTTEQVIQKAFEMVESFWREDKREA